MKTALTTRRLILREFSVADAEGCYNLNSDPEVLRYTGDIPFESIEDAKNFLKNYSDYRVNGYGRYSVILKESGRFIGWCGLKLNEENLVDLGFRFLREEWGKGYATESARTCLEFGFTTLEIDEIIGRSAKQNKASIQVLEKLGMEYWKTEACHGIENAAYYRLTKKLFKKRKLKA